MRTIELTDRELDLLMEALHSRIAEVRSSSSSLSPEMADLIEELDDLAIDLLAERAGHFDGWRDSPPPAALAFIDAGIDGREALKERRREAFADSDVRTGSMAAERRRLRGSDKS